MENKINIAELLRDYPKGMELDCTMYDNVTFNRLQGDEYIIINRGYNNGEVHLTKFGQMFNTDDAKCVIFPKGKTTWEGFRRPFVEGDIVSTENGMYIGIVKFTKDNHYCHVFCSINDEEDFVIDNNLLFSRFATENEKQKLFNAIKENGYKWNDKTKTLEKLTEPIFKDGDILAINDTVYIYNGKEELSPFPIHHAYAIADKNGLFAINTSTKRYGTRFATEEEKNILFEAIKDNGYRWNLETNTLEKLIEPKFKVGDRIHNKNYKNYIYDIYDITDKGYRAKEINADSHILILFGSQEDNYELVLNKFDISKLKPFDQVLVRDDNECVWKADFYSHYKGDIDFCYVCTGDAYTQCIPYNEENAHLVGTNHDCSDKYKTWKNE